jgi:hypothetical protein
LARPIFSLAVAFTLLENVDFVLHHPDGCLAAIGIWGLLAMAVRVMAAWSWRSGICEVLPLSKGELQRDQAIQFLYSAGFLYLDFLLVYFALAPVSSSAMGNLAAASLFAFLQAAVFVSLSLLFIALRINPPLLLIVSSVLAYVWLWPGATVDPSSGVAHAIWRGLLRWNPFGWLGAYYLSGWVLDRWDSWVWPALVAGIFLTLPFSYRRYRRMQREGTMPVNEVELKRPSLLIVSGESAEPMIDAALIRKEIVEGDALGLRDRKDSGFIAKLGGRFLSGREFSMADALRLDRQDTNRRFWKYLAWIAIYGGSGIWIQQTIYSISIDDLIRRSKLTEAMLIFLVGALLFALTAVFGIGLFRWNFLESGGYSRAVSPRQRQTAHRAIRASARRMYRLFPITKWELSQVIVKWNTLVLPFLLLPTFFVRRGFTFDILAVGERFDVYVLTKALISGYAISLVIEGISLDKCSIARHQGWRLFFAALSSMTVIYALCGIGAAFFYYSGFLPSCFFLLLLLAGCSGWLRYCVVKYLREC